MIFLVLEFLTMMTSAGTSYRTNVVSVQPENLEVIALDAGRNIRPTLQTVNYLKRLCQDQHVVHPYQTVKHGQPALRPEININCQSTNTQRRRGVIHTLVSLADDQTNVPAD